MIIDTPLHDLNSVYVSGVRVGTYVEQHDHLSNVESKYRQNRTKARFVCFVMRQIPLHMRSSTGTGL